MTVELGHRAKLRVVLNPWARVYKNRVVTVVKIPSDAAGYDCNVRAADGRVLAVNWSQLERHPKFGGNSNG